MKEKHECKIGFDPHGIQVKSVVPNTRICVTRVITACNPDCLGNVHLIIRKLIPIGDIELFNSWDVEVKREKVAIVKNELIFKPSSVDKAIFLLDFYRKPIPTTISYRCPNCNAAIRTGNGGTELSRTKSEFIEDDLGNRYEWTETHRCCKCESLFFVENSS